MGVDRGDATLHWREHHREEVARGYDWLSAGECRVLSKFRFTRRRSDWRLGRWTAKRALTARLAAAEPTEFVRWSQLSDISIVAAPDGAPEAFIKGRPAPYRVSISHSGGRAFCVTAPAGVSVGCDIEGIESRGGAFARDYFTTRELERVDGLGGDDRALLETLLWSAKESALKALRDGLRRDTRDVEVHEVESQSSQAWNPLMATVVNARDRELAIFYGWWRSEGGCVYTVATNSPAPPPALVV